MNLNISPEWLLRMAKKEANGIISVGGFFYQEELTVTIAKRNRRIRGRWFWREQFYSICSCHYEWDANCHACQAGVWRNIWMHHVGHFFYRFAYPLWHWWVNRPNSRSRRELERLFPNLKRERTQ